MNAYEGREDRLLNLLAKACGVLAALFGFVALFGWIAGYPLLSTFGSGRIPMAPSTSLLFMVYGAGILALTHYPLNRTVRGIGMVIGSGGAFISLLLFFFSYHGLHPQAEHLGFRIDGTVNGVPIGHISPLTAFCFVLAGLSFLASLSSSSGRRWLAAAAFGFASLVVLTGVALLLAYLFGSPLLYGTSAIPPALTTSLAFLALGAGLMAHSVRLAWPHGKLLDTVNARATYVLILIFISLATAIVAAGYFYFQSYEKSFKTEIERQLSAIADLKVGELVQWRKERLGDGAVFYKNPNFSGLVQRFLEAPGDRDARVRLQTWLNLVPEAYDQYNRVSLLDTKALERISATGVSEPVAPHLAQDVSRALRSGEVVFLDFHRDLEGGPICLSVLVPIIGNRQPERALGILVLRIDPEKYLYPTINRWPTPSKTAETLIIRREGNDVLYLNELRFRKNTALNLRIPLENVQMPAVKAALGQEGIFEGIDYRGVPVIAYVRSVPNSPWFLVARMDVSEICMPLRKTLWEIVILMGALLICAGAGVGLVWRHQRICFYRARYEAAEELQASEARYRSALDNMLEGCQIIGFDWRYRYVNESAARSGRREKEELLGRTIMETYPGIEATEMFAVLRRCMEERTPQLMENEFIYPDGTKAWFQLSIQPVPEGIFILSLDITERKRAEEALHASYCFLQIAYSRTEIPLLLEEFVKEIKNYAGCAAVGIRMLDGEGNIPYQAYKGFSRNFFELESPLSIKADQCMCINVIKGDLDPKMPFYTEGGSFYMNGTTRFLATVSEEEKGQTRNVCNQVGYESVALVPIRLKDDILGLIHVADPGTDKVPLNTVKVLEKAGMQLGTAILRRRAEESLRESEEKARQLGRENAVMAEIGRIISSTLNIDEVYESFSEEVKKIISFDRIVINVIDTESGTVKNAFIAGGAVQDRNAKDIYPLEGSGNAEMVRIKSTLLIQTENFDEYEGRFPMLRSTFQAGYRSIMNVPLFSKGKIIGGLLLRSYKPFAYTDEDIRLAERIGSQIAGAIANAQLYTEHIQAEKERAILEEQLRQSQKMEAIGQLAGGVAHDFNNLLTIIKGYSELSMVELKEEDPLKGNIDEIQKAADKAAGLTRQLLAFSRRQVLEAKVVDLNAVLKDLDKMLRRMIREDVELVTRLTEDLGSVKVDPGQIEQVVMNLAINARDAMVSGGKLTIETANAALDEEYARRHVAVTPGRYVMLSVSDTGVGMTPEVKERIFEPFFTTKEKGKGTGLGLSTVYGIVKQSGGNIWVYSELGRGTTFKIYLPRVDEPVEEIGKEAVPEELPAGNETILIVEDNEEVRKLAARILEKQGYKLLIATQGSEALLLGEKYGNPIHLMVTDVVMPGMDGRELANRLKVHHPETRVLYMSGYTDDTIAHRGILEKGMNYIQKPFTVERLLRKVREVLDK